MKGVAIFFILILVACALAKDVTEDEAEEMGGMARIVPQPLPLGVDWLGSWMQEVVRRLDAIEARVQDLEGTVGITYT